MSKMGSVLGLYLNKKIGPYKVCIFVYMGHFEKLVALVVGLGWDGVVWVGDEAYQDH